MKNATIKTPRTLSCGDPIFEIVCTPLDEQNVNPTSTLKSYHVKCSIIESIDLQGVTKKDGLNNAVLVINKRYSVPFNGITRAPGIGELIIDEEEARELILDLIRKEKSKAEKLVDLAKKELKGVEGNLSIFEDRSVPLYRDEELEVNLKNKEQKGDE